VQKGTFSARTAGAGRIYLCRESRVYQGGFADLSLAHVGQLHRPGVQCMELGLSRLTLPMGPLRVVRLLRLLCGDGECQTLGSATAASSVAREPSASWYARASR